MRGDLATWHRSPDFASLHPGYKRASYLELRCQQHLATGGGQIGHSGPGPGFRGRGRRLGMQDRVGEPVVELLAAAVFRGSRRLRRAFGTAGRAVQTNMEVIVVSPPR